MRIRPGTWLLISLLLFALAAVFWRLGENERLRSLDAGPASPAPVAPGATAPAVNPAAPAVKSVPVPPAVQPAPATEKPKAEGPSEKKLYPYRLSNTSRDIKQLARSDRAVLLNNALIDTGAGKPVPIPDHLRAKGDPGGYIVQSRGLIDGGFLNQLQRAGAQIISYLPNNAYLVKLNAAGARRLEDMGRVQSVMPWQPYYKLDAALLKFAVEERPLPAGAPLRLTLLPGEQAAAIEALQNLGAEVLGEDRSPFGPQLIVRPPLNALAALAGLPAVQGLEPYLQRVPLNDLARVRVGVSSNSLTATPNWLNLTGTNVLVAVIDSPVDPFHPDLTNQVSLTNRVFTGAGTGITDPWGHGTFVAGIIGSSGANSPPSANVIGSAAGANYRGMAPAVNLLSLDFGINDTYAGTAPFLSLERGFDGVGGARTMGDALVQEYAARSNIFLFGRTNSTLIANNSWGYDSSFFGGIANRNLYNSSAASYDAAVRDAIPGLPGSQPVAYVFAVGNRGLGGSSGQGGIADTITSPATAKNVISVSAIENERDSVAGTDPGKTRGVTNIITRTNITTTTTNVTQIAEWQPLTDNSNEVYSGSSRGNVGVLQEGAYGRFKPDLVAPGTFPVSTRSTSWDETKYYNPSSTTYEYFTNLTISPGRTNSFAIFVFNNATNLAINLTNTPPLNLLIYTNLNQAPRPSASAGNLAGANNLSIPVDTNLQNNNFYYDIVNTNTVPIRFDIQTAQIRTNDYGDYFQVLSNLNGGSPPKPATQLAPYYRYEIAGTSFSAPVISGMLALMQEFFEQKLPVAQRRTNSPAMMKALLINSARSVSANYGLQVTNFLNLQGWGMPYMQTVIPEILFTEPTSANWPIQFFDQSETNAITTGERHARDVTINAPGRDFPLRVSLVWTDPPGNPNAAVKLVNDLNLIVSNNVSGEVYYGNAFPGGGDFSSPNGVTNVTLDATNVFNSAADIVNNVENVYINSSLSNNYTIIVEGYRVNVNAVPERTNSIAQDYALVISSGNLLDAGALTVAPAPTKTTNTAPNVLFLSGTTNQVLMNQRVGANVPLLTTTNGTTNQWTFYVITNAGGGTNVFATFLPVNAARPRNASADIDLFVATDPNLTNLDTTVIANCFAGAAGHGASTNRGGTEIVKFTNAVAGATYYVGIKSEDQQSAEFNFFAAFSTGQLARQNEDGSVDVFPFSLPAGGQDIPDGSPDAPGITNVLAFNEFPITIRRVVVTNNVLTHENFGDLMTVLSHEGVESVLQNHGFPSGLPQPDIGGTVTIVYDDSDENDIAGSQPSEGTPNLQQFIGQDGIGMWILTAMDNQLNHTGRVDDLVIHLDPSGTNNLGGGTTGGTDSPRRVADGAVFLDVVNVPPEAVSLTINVGIVSGSGPVGLLVRRGTPPDLTPPPVYDHSAVIFAPGGSLTITRGSVPPLSPGAYYVALTNNSGGDVIFTLRYNIQIDLAATAPISYVDADTMVILDNSLTNSWSSRIPVGLSFTASVTNKTLINNLVTLTTDGAHSFSAGDRVQISGVGNTGTGVSYNGTFTVFSVPTPNTFTYGLIAANDGPTAVVPPGQALLRDVNFTFSSSVTNKSVTANLATLTTDGPHNFVARDRVQVSGVGFTGTGVSYDGTFTVFSVPTPNTFTYLLVSADDGPTAVLLPPGQAFLANATREVAGVRVGVRIDHPRASDLVLRLVAPSGKRVLLSENRGYDGPNGFGMGTNSNELAFAVFTENTSIAPKQIKYAFEPAFLDFIPPQPVSTNYLTDTDWTVGTSISTGGRAAEARMLIPTGRNEGRIRIDWAFYRAPDRIQVYYEGALIYDTGWTNNQPSFLQFAPADVDPANDIITIPGHGLIDGTQVVLVNPFFSTADTPPGGLQTLDGYFVVGANANTFKLEATLGGGAIDITSQGTGLNTLYFGSPLLTPRTFNVSYGSAASSSTVVEVVVNGGTNPNAGTVWDYTFELQTSAGVPYTFIGSKSVQRATSVAINGGNLYLAGTTEAFATNGIVARFGLPIVSNSVPIYSLDWPTTLGANPRGGTRFNGISTDPGADAVYVAGTSYTVTTDTTGTKEHKGIVAKFPFTAPQINANGPNGSVFNVQVPASPAALNAFTYAGVEELLATKVVIESGTPYIYVTGHGQENAGNPGRMFISKLDPAGNVLWTTNDATPGIVEFSSGRAITTLGANIYVAGVTNDGVNILTYLTSFDQNGNTNWIRTNLVGQYNGIIGFEGALYVVGSVNANAGATADFLIQKWDESGNLLWSRSYDHQGDEDILNAVVGYGNRLYAVGSARKLPSGDSDVAVLEIDQATGNLVTYPTTAPSYTGVKTMDGGWNGDDAAYGAASDGFDLYIVGEGRRYDPLVRTDPDALLLRYRIKNDYLPEESLSSLIGELANGNWQLEIWDNREGGTNTTARLLGWQLQLNLSSTNGAAFRVDNGVFLTNTLRNDEVIYFIVDAPFAASQAFHDLETLASSGTGLMTLSFDQTGLPSATRTTTYDIIPATALGNRTLLSYAGTPTFVPGQRYYLAVRNDNPGETNTFRLRVDFDNSATTFAANSMPVAGASASASAPNNLYNFIVGATQPGFYFQMKNLSGNVAVRLRRGALPTSTTYDFTTNFSTTNLDQALVQTNSSLPLLGGTWYASVQNLGPGAASYEIVIEEVNIAPVISPVGDQSITDGQTLTLIVSAQDNNHPPDNFTFSLLSPPTGATINPATGVFTWTPTPAQAPGNYLIRVVVIDDGTPPLSATNTFNVTVNQQPNDPPVVSMPGPKAVVQDTALAIGGVSVSDPDAGSGTLQMSLWATNGTLTVTPDGGLVIVDGTNGMTTNLVLEGTLTVLNTALGGLSYQGLPNFHGSDLLTVVANDRGNTGAGGARQATNSVAITVLATQTISFGVLSDKTFGDAPFTVNATASSGLPVSFNIVSGPATVSGNTVTMTGAGAVVVRASQAGNSEYIAAPGVDQSFSVAKATPVITWSNPASIIYGTPLSGTQLSATVNAPGSLVFSPAGGVVLDAGLGQTLSVEFIPAQPANYNSAGASVTINVLKAGLTATTANKSRPYGAANPALTGTLSGVVNNDNITASYSTTATPASAPGAYPITLALSDPNNRLVNYTVFLNNGTLTVTKASQTITFGPLANKTYGDAPFAVSATATSGLPVSFSIVSGPATLSGDTITITGAGTVTVRAAQTGDANYDPAPNVDRSFVVNKATPVVTWSDPADITYGTPLSGTQLNATASVPGSLVYSPASGAVVNAGSGRTLFVTFTPTDTANYSTVIASVAINVLKASLTVTADNQTRPYGTANPTLTGVITGLVNNDNITPNYSTTATSGSAPGDYPITVALNDPNNRLVNYTVSLTNATLTVIKADQTITFGPLPDKRYGEPPFAINATASSGLPVSFTIVSGPATLSGNTVTVTDFGTIIVRAAQAGNGNYNAAPDVDQSFTVNSKGTPVITWSNPANFTYGTALSDTQLNATASVPGSFVYSPASGAILTAGNGQTLSVTFTPTDTASYNPVNASVTINVLPAGLNATGNNASRVYGDANPTFSGSLTGLVAGDTITATFTTPATLASTVGSHPIVPLLEDAAGRLANYVVTTNAGALTITKAALAVTPNNASRPYGQANPTLTGTFTGLKNADNITASYATTATPTSAAGATYPITATLVDPDGRLANYTVTLNTGTLTVTRDDPPVLGLAAAAATYVEKAPPVVLDITSTVTDGGSPDFDGGSFRVSVADNGEAADRLGLRHEGFGAGKLSVFNNVVAYSSVQVGNFSGGVGAQPLLITLNRYATPAVAQVIMRNLTYSNASANPITGPRTVEIVLADGDGGVSLPAAKQVQITPVNDAPTVFISAPATNAQLKAGYGQVITAEVGDVDGTVVKVEFFEGANKLGEALTAPFSLVWSNAALGSYSLSAVATDDQGGSTNSATVPVTVNPAISEPRFIPTQQAAQFEMTFIGVPGISYNVEVSTDLLNWSVLTNFMAAPGSVPVFDPNAFGVGQRFYRIRQAPQ